MEVFRHATVRYGGRVRTHSISQPLENILRTREQAESCGDENCIALHSVKRVSRVFFVEKRNFAMNFVETNALCFFGNGWKSLRVVP